MRIDYLLEARAHHALTLQVIQQALTPRLLILDQKPDYTPICSPLELVHLAFRDIFPKNSCYDLVVS